MQQLVGAVRDAEGAARHAGFAAPDVQDDQDCWRGTMEQRQGFESFGWIAFPGDIRDDDVVAVLDKLSARSLRSAIRDAMARLT